MDNDKLCRTPYNAMSKYCQIYQTCETLDNARLETVLSSIAFVNNKGSFTERTMPCNIQELAPYQ